MYNVGLNCYLVFAMCVAGPCTMYFANINALLGNSVAINDNACTAFSLYIAAAVVLMCWMFL